MQLGEKAEPLNLLDSTILFEAFYQKRSLLGAFGGLFGGSGGSWGPFLEIPGPLGELLGSLLGGLEALGELSEGFGCNLELSGVPKLLFSGTKWRLFL